MTESLIGVSARWLPGWLMPEVMDQVEGARDIGILEVVTTGDGCRDGSLMSREFLLTVEMTGESCREGSLMIMRLGVAFLCELVPCVVSAVLAKFALYCCCLKVMNS